MLPESVREPGRLLLGQIADLNRKVGELESRIRSYVYEDEEARLLMTIPGVCPITASAILVFAPPMASFWSGRDFSVWLGFVTRQHSTGGKSRRGKVSKMGQRDIRRLLITGAMTVVRWADRRCAPTGSAAA